MNMDLLIQPFQLPQLCHPFPPPLDINNTTISQMQAEIYALQAKVKALESDVLTAKVHCALTLSEVDLMKKKLNRKKKS
ncbi:hypothetical protein PAXRUDRAFT_14009 [Paxillus rubicundulus Ve08.2h10]|uniref:Uncharacterized protein n=1 Tax=Paxillus rubicundulus Ve08.2h10 TaxID=930991 RepID=A0A0D0DSF2_9AGAM|nr:hypothetical protein PAXRUDRAFT_14009 [Paxillus rubicundulus Ve08.2h10]